MKIDYRIHNLCRKCQKLFSKDKLRCEICNNKLRLKPRYSQSKRDIHRFD